MNYIYQHKQTLAYFSIKSLEALKQETDFALPHPWFTILLIENSVLELKIDDISVPDNFPSAVFLTPGQHFNLQYQNCNGYAISFNKEFYCIEYHDKEVSCNGLLFVNNYRLVQLFLDQQQLTVFRNTVKEMAGEFAEDDLLQCEMLKNLLKNLLIRSNRLFRAQYSTGEIDNENIDFTRKFSQLVEKHYKTTKQVETYAEMMNIAPATLTKKLQKYGIESPSKIIRSRVVTEAKRLLIYSEKSVKEIADAIGYEDQHYFSRLFTKETNISPSEYRKQQQRV